MARAYKCDRCGAFYSSNTKLDKITTRRYDNSHAMREFDDLCEKCTKELMTWFYAVEKEMSNDVLDQ